MEYRQLEQFLAVIEYGSLNKAAISLNLSRPSLSQSIRALEQSVGATLWQRHTDGMELTTAGKALWAHAKKIVDQGSAVRQPLSNRPGFLRVGVLSTLATPTLTDAIQHYNADSRHQGLELSIGTWSMDDISHQLHCMEWDIAFTLLPTKAAVPREIISHPICAAPSSVFCRSLHPLAQQSTTKMADLGHYDWIISNQASALHITQLLEEQIGQPLRVKAQTDEMWLMRSMLLEGDFLCLLPDALVEADRKAGRIVRVPVEPPVEPSTIALLYSSFTYRDVSLRALMSTLDQAFAPDA